LLLAFSQGAIGGVAALHPSRLVLQKKDVGAKYVKNATFSGPTTLAEAGSGDSRAIRRQLKRIWLAGYRTGFNGISVRWGISSTADVFRTAGLRAVERAWTSDILRAFRGRVKPSPLSAPGTFRLLIQGRVGTAATEFYMWQRGRVLASVDVTGPAGVVPRSLLMTLVRRQDSKIRVEAH
jgi:hypothetical protein